MRRVEQRSGYDCMTACLATVFEVPYEDAPILCDQETGNSFDRWHGILDEWLYERGWAVLERMQQHGDVVDQPKSPWRFPGLWIAGVKSPRTEGGHAIVMVYDEVWWDPHPERDMGHLGFECAYYFLPLDPAKFALRARPYSESMEAALVRAGGL